MVEFISAGKSKEKDNQLESKNYQLKAQSENQAISMIEQGNSFFLLSAKMKQMQP